MASTAPPAPRRPLTVVQLLPALESGGVEQSTLEIAEALQRQGHAAIVVSAGGRLEPALAATGARHIRLDIGRKSPWTLRHVFPLRKLFDDVGADVVHARSRLPAWLACWALRLRRDAPGPRLVTTVHGLNSPSRYSAVMTRGERVICVSETVRRHVLEHYPDTDPDKLRVIPRGVDPRRFPRAPTRDLATRARIAEQHPALGGYGALLLMPGRGTRLKGHADALQLLARLRADGEDARLWMPGTLDPARAAYVAELEGVARVLGVEEFVAITEPTDAMAEAYAASDLVLQLSRRPEAFGRTVLEARAVGRAVLGWDHGGVGDTLRDWQPEGLVEPFDMDALRVAAHVLLARPPEPPATMPDTLRVMQDATLAVYADLID